MLLRPAFSITAAVLSLATTAAADFNTDFRDPPAIYRPKFRYWLPDATVPASNLKADLDAIADVGAGGLEFLPFYLYGMPTPEVGLPPTDWATYGFGSKAFKEVLKVALEQAQKRGLVVDLALGANQGQGVPAKPGGDGLAVELAYGTKTLKPGSGYEGNLPEPMEPNLITGFMAAHEKFGEKRLVAVIAGQVMANISTTKLAEGRLLPMSEIHLNQSSIVDLTHLTTNGSTLQWNPPPSVKNSTEWVVMAFYEKHTNERSCAPGVGATTILGNGSWIVDHFNKSGAEKITDFWDENLLDTDEMRELVRSVGSYTWEDSMEQQAALYWTPGFLSQFQERRGYSAVKYLPLFFNASNQWIGALPAYNETYVFGNYTTGGESVYLADYRQTLTEGYMEYLNHFRDWSAEIGLGYSNQPAYNLPLDMSATIPLIDAPETESLGFGNSIDAYRHFSGPALFSKKTTVVSTEVGAVRGAAYTLTVPELLTAFRQSFAGGISMMMIHGYTYSGDYPKTTWPGYTPFYYQFTEMWNMKLPAWGQMKEVMGFVGRVQRVLQEGEQQTDLAWYFNTVPWVNTNDSTKTEIKELGYSFNYIGPDNFLLPTAVVSNNNLLLAGNYKALVFADEERAISPAAVEKLQTFAVAGLPIFFVGTPPSECIGHVPDCSVREDIRAIISDHQQDNVYTVATLADLTVALKAAGIVPRTAFSAGSEQASTKDWYSVWRSSVAADKTTDYVYLFNAGPSGSVQVKFEVPSSATPYLLDAWTGEQTPVAEYTATRDGITVPVTLRANQSLIYSFSSSSTFSRSSSAPGNNNSTANNSTSLPTTTNTNTNTTGEVAAANATTIQLNSWNLAAKLYHPTSNISSASMAYTTRFFNLTQLQPWTAIPALQDSSGVGTYSTKFTLPRRSYTGGARATLSFGPIYDTLRAWLNGVPLPPVDPAVGELDITRWLKPEGENELMVRVTTTLFNVVRKNADQVHMPGAEMETGLGPNWYEAMDRMKGGLVGPVVVRA